jgi:hypothetical protein
MRANSVESSKEEKTKRREYYDLHREQILRRQNERRKRIREAREKEGRTAPLTAEQFRDTYGYEWGSLDGWQQWDEKACQDLACEHVRYFVELYRTACGRYAKFGGQDAQLGYLENILLHSPGALYIDMKAALEIIRQEYGIYRR